MFLFRYVFNFGFLTLFAALIQTQNAQATLGNNDNSVESDRVALNGTVKTTTQKNFTIREITTPNGISIKEYVSSQGSVFGITWRGMVHPDLQLLLGSYHAEYLDQETHKNKKFGRGHETLSGPNVVVEKEGHMRDVHGRAYVPASIPDGVTAEDIQ